jgi:hypothetical protein
VSTPERPGIDARTLAWVAAEWRVIFGKLELHGAELTRANRLLKHMLRALAEGVHPDDLPELRVIDGGADEGDA